MNELKPNNKIIRSVQSGKTSNVSTYVRREEKNYVYRYAMPKKKVSDWIDNNFECDENLILHPSLRKFKAEEAISDPDRREKARLFLICFGIALVLLLIIPAVKIATAYLVIEEIRVEGSSLYSESELLGASGLRKGDALPLMSASNAETLILTNLPYVQSCEISFELPNVLIIHMIDEAPALYSKIEDDYYIFTSSLRILERTSEEGVPDGLLYVELPRVSKAIVGEEIILEEVGIGYITEFIRLINDSPLRGRLDVVYLEEKFDIVASVDDKFRVMFGSPSDMALKIDTVALIIDENKDKCNGAGIIDVRLTDVCGLTLDADIDPSSRE